MEEKEMRIGVIVQARMGSTRLPGKIMKDLYGKTVLAHDIERIKQSKRVDVIIVATTTNEEDDIIEKEALKCGVKCFRGKKEDVLSRYYYAAKENNIDAVVRVTSDCPLYDPHVLNLLIEWYENHDYDVVTNTGIGTANRSYPRGLDTEIFGFLALEKANNNAAARYQREHVTPYIYENEKHIYYYQNTIDQSRYRWTLDTKEDWELISGIYKYLYHGKHDFYLDEIIKLMEEHPELYYLNKDVEQKELKG